MRILRHLFACFFVTLASLAMFGEAAGKNYADQWWVPTESGWGVSVQQQDNVLLVELLIYRGDNSSVWYLASATLQSEGTNGHDIYVGDLYETRGPGFAEAFDPKLVSSRKVGTLTFNASSVNQAALAYSVDGVLVAKDLVRQTWSQENLTGRYTAVWYFGCGDIVSNWGFTDTVIVHRPDNSLSITAELWVAFFEIEYVLVGTYSQAGHNGQVAARIVVPEQGNSLTITEIQKTRNGFTGRILPVPGCGKEGRIVAVGRP